MSFPVSPSNEVLRAWVDRLDVTEWDEIERTWDEIRPFRRETLRFMREAYPRFRKWQGRSMLAYKAIFDAREDSDAYEIGVMAVNDRARMPRYRGIQVLAYSLRPEALPLLARLKTDGDPFIRGEAEAAYRAVAAKNHHLYIDRRDSGRAFWIVNEDDDPTDSGPNSG